MFIKPIFSDTAGPGLRALFFVLLAVFLLILYQHSTTYRTWCAKTTSVVAFPIHCMVDLPIRFASWVSNTLATRHHLISENEKLTMQIVSLQTDLQKLSALENENVELRELLRTTLKTNTRSHVARLLAVSLDPNIQQMVIDQGSLQQVTAGQPVLDAHGVIGRVIDVGPMSSKVLLITDTRSAIPVLDIRSQERAVAIGLGSTGQLQLINVPNLNQIQVGDSFVTSGLDGRYPSGYPVGVVASIQDNKDSHARDIILSPTARIDQAKYVLLMVPTITNARSR